MNIQLTETQCEEVIESIEWIAEEYPQYDDIDKDNHKDIVSAYHSLVKQLNEYRRTNEV